MFVHFQGLLTARPNRFRSFCDRRWTLERESGGNGWRVVVLVYFFEIVAIIVQLRIKVPMPC